MEGKIVIITGANSGIGKAATMKFAKEGFTVVMACRNLEKSRLVQEEIMKRTQNSHIDLIEVDVSSFESIKQFCTTFKDRYCKLDILIHNAGCFNHGVKEYQLSKDHIELSFATNVIGPYYMTQLLRDSLKRSDDPRILHACSTNIRHFFEPKRQIEFDNLQGEFKDTRKYSSYKMYGDSKMALLLLTFKLAEVLKEDGIGVNAIQIPSIKIAKQSIKKLKFMWRVAARLQNLFNALPETMADTYFHVCTSDAFKEITGKLINEKQEIVKPSHYGTNLTQDVKQFLDKSVYPRYADDKEQIERVWQVCKKLTQLT